MIELRPFPAGCATRCPIRPRPAGEYSSAGSLYWKPTSAVPSTSAAQHAAQYAPGRLGSIPRPAPCVGSQLPRCLQLLRHQLPRCLQLLRFTLAGRGCEGTADRLQPKEYSRVGCGCCCCYYCYYYDYCYYYYYYYYYDYCYYYYDYYSDYYYK